jgi:23S rRNA maturation mini-RNase III
MKKDKEYFVKKQNRLNAAIEKVAGKLLEFQKQSDQMFANFDTITEQEKESCRKINNALNWNEHHDLHDRLEQRLWANWSDFKDWHWEKYQFNTY